MNKKEIKKIGVMTGGGDCPGLNAVIAAVAKTAVTKYGLEVVGIKNGYRGLYLGEKQIVRLDAAEVGNIIARGGTILYNSNKDNLFKYPRRDKNGIIKGADGKPIYDNLSQVAVDNLNRMGIDALVIIGGDGTLTSGRDFARMGVPVIGVPKTIDNDLNLTDTTFGFDTAVSRCVEAIKCINTTGLAHHRIMVLEVMGREAGHIALTTGIASAADVILIPEIAYDIEKVAAKAKAALKSERQYGLIVVAEGVSLPTGGKTGVETDLSPDGFKFKGAGDAVAEAVQDILNNNRDENGYAISDTIMDVEARCTVLGHVQRGGTPTAYDRILCARYGKKAVEALMDDGKVSDMVALRGGKLVTVPLEDVIPSNDMHSNFRPVDVNGELMELARTLGISFGDR
ncbi:MAG: ATP-dependent 6-phosphofructokinase [Bacillota bacterium]|nr:ATP-dependent 6-phosphofructokinase [Bacillota bacterium]